MPRTSEKVTASCQQCGEEVVVTVTAHRHGRGRYCSQTCYAASRIGKPRGPYGHNKVPESRNCLVCGDAFTVGGRANANRRQKVCSMACQRASRLRKGSECARLSDTEAAYIAGLIDGEGSIMLVSRPIQNAESISLVVSITNTSMPMLEWLVEHTKIGTVCRQYDETEKRKATGFWRVASDGAETLLRQVLPYLVTKTCQAELALLFREQLRNPKMRANRTWQANCRDKMKSLNYRGVRPK